VGPFAKTYEKLATAVDRWMSASNKAFEQMKRIFRKFEIKSGQRAPDLGRNKVFVANQQVNLTSQAPTPSSSVFAKPPSRPQQLAESFTSAAEVKLKLSICVMNSFSKTNPTMEVRGYFGRDEQRRFFRYGL
jgi:hypothetical protein